MVLDHDDPLVTVILPVFNGEKYLKEAVDSILLQTYRNIELIFVDDGSADNTYSILSSYNDPRITLLQNDTNIGKPASINRALAQARGKYVCVHDADDVSLPQRIEKQISELEANENLVLIGSSYHVISDHGKVIETAVLPTSDDELRKRLQYGNIFAQPAVLMRKDILERIGGYTERFRVSQDYDVYLRLSEYGEMANLAEPLCLIRFHSESISRNKRELQLAYRQLAWDLAQQRRLEGYEKPLPENILDAYPPEPDRLFFSARRASYLYYVSGSFENATESLRKAVNIQDNFEEIRDPFSEWILSSANHLAEMQDNTDEGEKFIYWACRIINENHRRVRDSKTLAKYYTNQAFLRDGGKPAWQNVRLILNAIKHDWTLINNQGLMVLLVRNILGVNRKNLVDKNG